MQNIVLNKEKDAVIVPVKDWEKMQKELIRLRKRAAREDVLKDLKKAIEDIEADLKLPVGQRKKRQSADEFLREMQNA